MTEPLTMPEESVAYRGKTILVTGAGGYIGSRLIQELAAVDCRIVRLVSNNLPPVIPEPSCAEITTVCGDVASAATWCQIAGPWDCVFHLAAFEHKRGSPRDVLTDLAVNAGAMLNVLETCRIRGYAAQVVLASSSNLAGKGAGLPVDEAAPDDPSTIYAIHKYAAERYLRLYARDYDVHGVALRLANVFGPGSTLESSRRVVFNRIIEKAVLGGPLTIFNNQHCIRDYVFLDDVVRAFLNAGIRMASARGTSYVIGSGEGISIGDAVRLVAERAAARIARTVDVHLDPNAPLDGVEWRDFVADSRRFTEATGWRPLVTMDDGIRRTINAFVNRQGRST